MKVTLHAKIELALGMALLLGSCSGDGARLYKHDEIEDIASDVAAGAIADSDRIGDLESRIEALEEKLGQ